MDLYKYIVNTKLESHFITGVVNSLNPLTVQIYAGDSSIYCKYLSSVIGIKIGSNVVIQKIGSQFIIIGVISENLTNLTDIASILTDIASNASAISSNASAISSNASNISNNASNISNNASAISTINDDLDTIDDALTVLSWYQPRYVKKSSDTSRYNTTSLTNDPHLTWSPTSTGKYEITANLFITYSSTPSSNGWFKCAWNLSGGVSQVTKAHTIGVSHTEEHATQFVAFDLGNSLAFGGTSSYIFSVQERFLVNVTDSSSVTLKWAQNTAEAINTTLKADSYLKVQKIVED